MLSHNNNEQAYLTKTLISFLENIQNHHHSSTCTLITDQHIGCDWSIKGELMSGNDLRSDPINYNIDFDPCYHHRKSYRSLYLLSSDRCFRHSLCHRPEKRKENENGTAPTSYLNTGLGDRPSTL